MPLVLKIERDGKMIKDEDLGILPEDYQNYFILNCVYTAACQEAAPDLQITEKYTFREIPDGMHIDFSWAPIYYMDWCPLMEKGEQILEEDHSFRAPNYDDNVDRFLELKAGDRLLARREHKVPQPPV